MNLPRGSCCFLLLASTLAQSAAAGTEEQALLQALAELRGEVKYLADKVNSLENDVGHINQSQEDFSTESE